MKMKRSEMLHMTFVLVVLAKLCDCSLDLVNHQGLINQLGITIPKQGKEALSIYLSIHLSISLYIYISSCAFIYLTICLSMY